MKRTQLASANPIHKSSLITLLVIAVLVSGCGGMVFSPAEAAIRHTMDTPLPEFTVNPNSIQVLQQVELGNVVIVLVKFSGTRASTGQEECLFTHGVERTWMGTYQGGGGGGGCSSQPPDPETQPISIMSGKSSGRDIGDPGYSEVSGEVFRDDVTSVIVTWSDGKVEQVDVINGTYLTAREGQFDRSKIEAINADGEVVYTDEMRIAPGKQ